MTKAHGPWHTAGKQELSGWTEGRHLCFPLYPWLYPPNFLQRASMTARARRGLNGRHEAPAGHPGWGAGAGHTLCLSEDLEPPCGPRWPPLRPAHSTARAGSSAPLPPPPHPAQDTPRTVRTVAVVLLLLGAPSAPGPRPREERAFPLPLAVLVPQLFVQGPS